MRERVNNVGAIARAGVNNGDVAERRERERAEENVSREKNYRRGKKNGEHEGAYENMLRNGRVFRHMCFVSVELATRQTRTGGLSAPHTKSWAQWFAAAMRCILEVKRLEDALFLRDLPELVTSPMITKPTLLCKSAPS